MSFKSDARLRSKAHPANQVKTSQDKTSSVCAASKKTNFENFCFVVDDDPSKKDLFNLNHRSAAAAVASGLLLVTVDGSHHGKILE